uniref:Uncharacterized protein n=1 Tax=Arundo donax TaxID=35708 RepID=A0A0A9BIR2_ARUDO
MVNIIIGGNRNEHIHLFPWQVVLDYVSLSDELGCLADQSLPLYSLANLNQMLLTTNIPELAIDRSWLESSTKVANELHFG